jgi:2-haloacid dehalogenase
MLNFDNYHAVTFDCYGTLMDWETGILSSLHQILSTHGKSADDARLLELYGKLEAEAESGEFHNYKDVLAEVVRGFGRELEFLPTEQEAASLAASIARWQPFGDTVASLRKLKTKYKLAIISNVDDDLFATTAPKLVVAFDQVITAQQARAYKPSLKPFHLAIERLNLDPRRILHVGQSLYHDACPAKSLGMGTVWVCRESRRPGVGAVKKVSATPDLQIPDLATLAATIFGD